MNTLKVINKFLTDMKIIDPNFSMHLGINLASYSENVKNEVIMKFDAEKILMNNKMYKTNASFEITYSRKVKHYFLKGKRTTKNGKITESELLYNLTTQEVYDEILKMIKK